MTRVAPAALAQMALMAALTAAGAWLRIPLPYVPVTLQLSFVLLSGAWLGPRRGAASQVVYVVLGLTGLPVFAGGGGLHYALDPTFGYLLAFPLAAWTVGVLTAPDVTFRRWLLALVAATAVVYAIGVTWLYLDLRFVVGQAVSVPAAAAMGLAPLPKDLALIPLTVVVARRVRRLLPPRAAAGDQPRPG